MVTIVGYVTSAVGMTKTLQRPKICGIYNAIRNKDECGSSYRFLEFAGMNCMGRYHKLSLEFTRGMGAAK
jgi:hypothetical protein